MAHTGEVRSTCVRTDIRTPARHLSSLLVRSTLSDVYLDESAIRNALADLRVAIEAHGDLLPVFGPFGALESHLDERFADEDAKNIEHWRNVWCLKVERANDILVGFLSRR